MWPEYCLLGVSYFYYPIIPIFKCVFSFALVSDVPEVFLPKYFQIVQQYFMLLTSRG